MKPPKDNKFFLKQFPQPVTKDEGVQYFNNRSNLTRDRSPHLARDRHHACRISSPPMRIQSNGSHVAVIFRGGIYGHIHIRSSDIHREANLLRIPYIILDGVKTITSSIRHSADPDLPLDAITNTSIMLYSASPSLGSLS